MDYSKTICQHCFGAGIFTQHKSEGDVIVDPCPYCDGSGYMVDGILTLPANVFESHSILDELDATEYNALTDAKKEGIALLLSCGKVDLNDGKAGKTRLWSWFGSESTTVANLTALLT